MEKLWSKPIALYFADDTTMEFNDLKEIREWDEERQEVWNDFNMIINYKKSVIYTNNQELLK